MNPVRARESDARGDSLMLLWEGSYFARMTFHADKEASQIGAKAARALMTAYRKDQLPEDKRARTALRCHL